MHELQGAGATFGPYRVVGEIGRGGMGVVYRAVDDASGRTVALKTVTGLEEGLLASIRREISALARLHHPGVVRILSDGVEAGVPWYAMELLQGASLRERLESMAAGTATAPHGAWADGVRGAAPPAGASLQVREAMALVKRICEPLAFVHGEGVVHADLKPENVLLRSDDEPVLMDFGLAASFAAGLSRESLVDGAGTAGTLWYISPEQVMGESIDARADLYALGCILYELVTGSPPFVDPVAGQVLQMHLTAVPEPPSRRREGVPRELDRLVLALLEKEPGRRLGYADAVASELARLCGESAAPPAGARPYLYRARLAGREEAMAAVQAAIVELTKGRGGVVLVEGESGAGKTRIAQAAASRASENGCRVLTGSCADVVPEDREPLFALERVLLRIADMCREGGVRRTARLVGPHGIVLAPYHPALRAVAGDVPDPPALPADLARVRVCEALQAVLRELSREAPLVLLLDDLQWADELTLAFLAHVARVVQGMRLLVIGTCRQEEVPEPLAALGRSPDLKRIPLGRLDRRGVADVAASMLALPDPPSDLVEFLTEATQGNPFFVGEYLRAAVAEGLVERDLEGRWRVSPTVSSQDDYRELGLPGPLRELVGRRLSHLPAGVAAMVEAAGILGEEIEDGVLASVAGMGEAPAREAVALLLHRHVLSEQAGGRLGFAHARIREVAAGAILPERRRILHRRAAEVLAENPEARASRPAAIARHWEDGGEPARAWPLYGEAASRAMAAYALDQAEGLFRAYLRLAPPSDESIARRVELAELVLSKRGDPAALEEARHALALARTIGARRGEARSLREIGRQLAAKGETPEARDVLLQARAVYADIGDETGAAATLVTVGDLADGLGDKLGARTCYQDALAVFVRLGDRRRMAPVLSRVADVTFELGRCDEARDLYRRAIAIQREIGDLGNECVTLGNLANLCVREGALGEARPLYEEALRLVRQSGDQPSEAVILLAFGTLHQMEGRLGDAVPLFDRAVELCRLSSIKRIEAIALGARARCRAALGDRAGVVEECREAVRLAREAQDRWYEPQVLGHLSQVVPDPEERLRLLDEAMAVHATASNRGGRAELLPLLAEARLELGRLPEALTTGEEAVAEARALAVPVSLAGALLSLARARRACGAAGSGEALDEAEALCDRLGLLGERAHCACERARAAASRGEDPSPHLEIARRLAGELSLPPESGLGREIARLETSRLG